MIAALHGKLKALDVLSILMIILAFMQFYAVNYAANNIFLLFCLLLCAAYVMIFPQTRVIDKANFAPLVFMGLWLVYSLLSYNWAIDKEGALEYSRLIFVDLALFFIFSGLFRNPRLLRLSPWFFTAVVCMYLATAVWELTTLQHLPVSRLYGKLTFVPSGPFYNENNLAGFLLLPLPFVLYLSALHRGWWLKVFSAMLVIMIFAVLTITGARIAMLAVGLFFFISFVFMSKWKTRLGIVLGLALVILAVSFLAGPILNQGTTMLVKELGSISSEQETARMSSLRIRKQLILEGLDITAGSAFMGVGAGNFETYMGTERSQRTGGITNAHNFVLELLGNFGLLITLAFLFIYVRWLYALYQRYKLSHGKQRSMYLMYLSSLLLFIATSVLPSSIKWNHQLWIYFAAVNAMAGLNLPEQNLYPEPNSLESE